MGNFIKNIVNSLDFNHLNEMAAAAVDYSDGDEIHTVHEKRKTPIFIDQHDIDFLQQFPPELWAKALVYRYDKLLYDIFEISKNNGNIPKYANPKLPYRHGRKSGELIFPKVRTYGKHLLHKVTADVDDHMYSQLKSTEKEKYIQHAKNNNFGSLGYVLDGNKRGKGLSASKGMVGMTEKVARDRLSSLYQGIKDGWLGEHPEDSEVIEKLKIGGGKGSDKVVHTKEGLGKLPGHGEKYGRTKDGKRIWYAYWADSGEMIQIKQYLPILRPAKMIPSESIRKHNVAKNIHDELDVDISDKDISKYRSMLNPVNLSNLNKEIEQITSWLDDPSNKKPVIGKDPKHVQRKKYKEKLKELKIKFSLIDIIKKTTKQTGYNDPLDVPDETFSEILESIRDRYKEEYETVLKSAPRYDVEDWNIHHFNPKLNNPHTRWSGFGTININWQQQETVHGALQQLKINPNEFWKDAKELIGSTGGIPDEITRGVDAYIKKLYTASKVAHHTMQIKQDEIVKNATTYFRNRLGSRAFMPFIQIYKDYKKGTVQKSALDNARRLMRKSAFQSGYTFAGMVFQLKNRIHKGQSMEDLEQLLSGDKSLEDKAKELGITWGRKSRPFDPSMWKDGQHGQTSHGIDVIHSQIQAGWDKLTNNPEFLNQIRSTVTHDHSDNDISAKTLVAGKYFLAAKHALQQIAQQTNHSVTEEEIDTKAKEISKKLSYESSMIELDPKIKQLIQNPKFSSYIDPKSKKYSSLIHNYVKKYYTSRSPGWQQLEKWF